MRSPKICSYCRQSFFWMLLALALSLSAGSASAQTAAFTYQGRLTDGGTPANGVYDLQFALWDSLSGGSQIGVTDNLPAVQVSNGVFAVTLAFGINAFPGANRFLEISARLTGASAFTLLTPRQQITSTPYAVRSANATLADTATNTTQLGGVAASQYVQTNDSRLTDSRTPTAGSGNYIQNTSNQQSGSNFNISGDGLAGGTLSGNVVNAVTQFNVGGSAILRVFGLDNTFVGLSTGLKNTSGQGNTYVGVGAGAAGTSGVQNTFVGTRAGSSNTGFDNSFFGYEAGLNNTIAAGNSFFGTWAGRANTGFHNSFFGFEAGFANSTGVDNSFFGFLSGNSNTTGGTNSFLGFQAGVANSSGNSNSFVGNAAGGTNTTGSNNTLVGAIADVGSNNLDHATAIGADAVVALSNSIALGRGNGSDTVRIPGKLVLGTLGAAGSIQLCRNGFLFNEIATCSSSLRYKKDIGRFNGGLNLVARLQPITFTWKDRPERDLGLVAEDVAKVEPLLITYNAKGEIEGVKYDRLNVVLINSIKQQQNEIERLSTRLQALEKQLRSRNRRHPKHRAMDHL